MVDVDKGRRLRRLTTVSINKYQSEFIALNVDCNRLVTFIAE